jgi:signal peptide peptidase SppA
MKYPALAASFYNTPHAISAEKFAEIEAFLKTRFTNAAAETAEYKAGPRDSVQMVGRVAVVPVYGVLAQRMNLMTEMSGGTSTQMLGAAIDNLVSDRTVKAIVLDVDSPGGSVFGIQELADKIHAATKEKRIVAVANSTAASAAYWLASQASELVVTTGGQVGSIGVIAAHTDESKAEEMAGVKTTLITAGEFKGEGYRPLTDSAMGAMQQQVDAIYSTFVRTVARGRVVSDTRVEKDFGQGRMKLAKEALSAGMVDRIATLEQTVRRLAGDDAARGARDRAAQMAANGLAT